MSCRAWTLRTATAAVAGICVAVAAAGPPAAAPHLNRQETCLTQGLQDLAAWRWVEPRLSGGFTWQPCSRRSTAGHAVEEASCPPGHPPPPVVSKAVEACDDAADREHVLALRKLVLRAGAPEETVNTLQALAIQAPTDPLLLSDLAAAYLVRARRGDRPADLLHALDAAERAVASAPGLPAARFNLALAEEALQLPASWQQYLSLDGASPWAAEARERRQRLAIAAARAEATSWSLNQERLPTALYSGDRRAVANLIRPYPAAAQQYEEETVLPAWAQAQADGREAEADRQLTAARELAAELAAETGDPYLAEAVGAITHATAVRRDPAALQALAAGHLALARARRAQETYHLEAAEERYRQARHWFAGAASPMWEGAELGLARALYQQGGPGSLARVLALVEPIARAARAHGHRHVLGRAEWIRALCLGFQGHPVESLAGYGDALAEFAAMGDSEDDANVRVRRAGVYRIVGEGELAWREIWSALPQSLAMADLTSRHHLLGEAAATALALGFPDIALRYEDQAVTLVEEALRAAGSANPRTEVASLRLNLAVALRWRAAIEVQAGRHAAAVKDLDLAGGLAGEPADLEIRRILQAEVERVAGDQERAANEPRQAIVSWRAALDRLSPDEDRFFRAAIYQQIALAYLALGNRSGAEHQLALGIAALRAQQRRILSGRRRGEGEEIWTACFARFQAEYDLLIRMLAEDGSDAAAFAYAEKAQAFEPLDLILRSPAVPAAFHHLAKQGEPMTLAAIRHHLPRGTVLLEYRVLADRLLTWVVWRGGFAALTQPVSRGSLERWQAALAESAQSREEEAFRRELSDPLAAAVTAPLAQVRKILGDRIGLVVCIPDGPLRGVPLAALRDAGTGRRVVEGYAVAMAPNATLYIYSRLRDARIPARPHPAVLLVGVPQVPDAAEEVAGIARSYPGARPLSPDQATAASFLARAGRSGVVHFAGHSYADPRYPFRSFLQFVPTHDHPGELYADEILRRLKLEETRLVVLASCASAGGSPIGPEGLAPLVRPLLAVGAPAVVGSLWAVGSPGTRALMVRFHRYFACGEDAAHALRHAQLDLAEGPVLNWAPFQLVGAARSPFPACGPTRREPS